MAPVVSLASHFDGGCPCESGKPIQLAGGGTCNAELAAMFAPRPMLVVSDGGDWTASVPTLEYPYLQRVYGFYGAKDRIVNVHLPKERHRISAMLFMIFLSRYSVLTVVSLTKVKLR